MLTFDSFKESFNQKNIEDVFLETAEMFFPKRDFTIHRGEDINNGKILMRFRIKDNFGNWHTIDRDVTDHQDDGNTLCKTFGNILAEAMLLPGFNF